MKRGISKFVQGILVLTLTVATQCARQDLPVPTCQRVYVLQDHYRMDSVYLRTDSLWPWGRLNNVLCGSDTLLLTGDEPRLFQQCGTTELLAIRFIIGNKTTQPKIYKSGKAI